MRRANVVNQDEIEWTEAAQGKFRYRRIAFTATAGMQRLGASIFEFEPSTGWTKAS
jgi:hypothetical protein